MTTPKFKIGDHVKWCDHEGRARSGVIVELPFGCPAQFDTCFIKEAWELQPGRWHESHLSLTAPEAASGQIKACELQALLSAGMPIFCSKVDALMKVSDGQKKEIERLNARYIRDIDIVTTRLTEEIGGRHRERIAKEAAQRESADAKNSVSNNYNAFVRGCESLTAAQKKNSQLTASLEALKSGIDKLRDLASEVSP